MKNRKSAANIVFREKRAESKLSSQLFPLTKLLFLKQYTNLVLEKSNLLERTNLSFRSISLPFFANTRLVSCNVMFKFSEINYLSLLIGSLIGILLSHFFIKISIALKLNNYRKLILRYNNEISIPKIETYIKDYKKAEFYILNYYSIVIEKNNYNNKVVNNYDIMPMLNSEVYKSIPNEFLFRILKKDDYSKMLNIIYSIEFLKANMPINLCTKFTVDIKNHLKEQEINKKNEGKHLKQCNYLEKIQIII